MIIFKKEYMTKCPISNETTERNLRKEKNVNKTQQVYAKRGQKTNQALTLLMNVKGESYTSTTFLAGKASEEVVMRRCVSQRHQYPSPWFTLESKL